MLGPVETVDEVDSTNRVLVERARAGAPHGMVLVADHQTAGRGRLDRRWEAAPGTSLLVSVLVRPELPADRAFLVTFAAGLAAADACAEMAGVRPELKWPNDLVMAEGDQTRKLAGLLAESVVERGAIVGLVVGMGLNLREGEHLPEGAVALDTLAGRQVLRDDLLGSWLQHFGERLESLGAGEESVLADYRQACATLGQAVRVERSQGVIEGRALDVDGAGRLLVETKEGVEVFAVGDVVHLRPGWDRGERPAG